MADDEWYKPNPKPTPPRQPKPGEHVWTLVKAGRRFECELRFQGNSYGWECQLLEDGELRHGWRFPLHQGTATEAEVQRRRFLREGWTAPFTTPPAG
jgi:hypothetical protein